MTEYEKEYAKFFYTFSNMLKKYKKEYHTSIIFLCIGTSKIIGDSFGPLVGEKLKRLANDNKIIVVGDLSENISAVNIDDKMQKIKSKYKNALIISIDAALSKKENIGKIKVYPYGIKIRKALENTENKIGNLSIQAIVASNYKKSIDNYLELKQTPFSRIDYLSDITVNGINLAIKNSDV